MTRPRNWSFATLERKATKLSHKTGTYVYSRATLVALFGVPSK